MICIYDKRATKNTVLNTNGIAVLDDICTKAEISEELTGDFGLSAVFLLGNDKWAYICEEAIIKCNYVDRDEVFRISSVTKRSVGKAIEVYAKHISYDALNLYIENIAIPNVNGGAFLTALFGATSSPHEFTYTTDITAMSPATYSNISLYDVLFTDPCCFINEFGADYLRVQYTMHIWKNFGADNGETIQSRKNLQGFEVYTNTDGLVTRIYPYGANNITIDEKYIDSPYISNYAAIRSKKFEFSGIKVDEENGITLAMAQQQLKDAANAKYSNEYVDILKAEYKINYVSLEKTEEYKNYAILERVSLGDIIQVYEENFNINIPTRVTQRTYNVLKGILKEVTLSNILTSSKVNFKKVVDKINQIENGKKTHTGRTTPEAGLGRNGDIYIQF